MKPTVTHCTAYPSSKEEAGEAAACDAETGAGAAAEADAEASPLEGGRKLL